MLQNRNTHELYLSLFTIWFNIAASKWIVLVILFCRYYFVIINDCTRDLIL